MTDNQRSFDACDRFFSIHEMVSYFLHTAPPLVLLKCHRVCKLWNEIISDSEICQQNLFLEPVERDDAEGPMVPRLNPILWECFGPVLACGTSKNKPDSQPCSYEDLLKLPWARDGDSMDAPARLAYARGEASWREMLVSQPPIRRLDWWHYWRTEDEESNAQYSMQDVPRGWGHQDSNGSSVTIGMLWDLIEARLKRGCQAQVLYFPKGSSVHEDETAGEVEREWEIDGSNQHRGFTTTLPRVKILTNHAWPGVEPEKCMKFSIEEDTWVSRMEVPLVQGTALHCGWRLLGMPSYADTLEPDGSHLDSFMSGTRANLLPFALGSLKWRRPCAS